MFNWFKKNPRSFDDVSLDDLLREKIRLQQAEKKLVREIDVLEEEKQTLFNRGKAVKGSQHRVRSIAVNIKSVDGKIQMTDKRLRTSSKELQAISQFIYLKENASKLASTGLIDQINSMDLTELGQFIERSTIDEQVNVDKLSATINQFNSMAGLSDTIQEDEDILRIMQEIQGGTTASGYVEFDDERLFEDNLEQF